MRIVAFFLLCFTICISGYSQKFTISGYIKDAQSSESLIGSTVLNSKTFSGSATNSHGFYSLTLREDSIFLVYSYVGYQPKVYNFLLSKDTVIDVYLESGVTLTEIEVNSTKADAIHETSRMSSFTIPIEQMKSLPAFMGETDILKILQLMPGIQSGNEGSTGLYVRGGGADQNLILLDGVPVYNASHLFGFFSVFNSEAINHVEVTKGGFPARYGGRLSSVIDINMKDGNMKELKGEGSVGIISSKLTIEAPIKKDKTSFIASARRTYIDILAQPFIRKQANGGNRGYYFYDLNLKVNHIVNPRNRLYLSTYLGNDKAYTKDKSTYHDSDITIKSKDEFGLGWGNLITAFRWNHIFGSKLFSNITTTYSHYGFEISQRYEEQQTSANSPPENLTFGNRYISGIRDWAAKMDFDYLPSPDHFIRFGFNSIWHKFSPGVYSYHSTVEKDTSAGSEPTTALELAAYVEDDWSINESIKINAGVHASAFSVDGIWYRSLQPRISTRILLTKDLAFKASFSNMMQFIHLLTNAGIGLPTDLWVSSTARIKPQQSNQVAIGFAKTYKSEYEFSLEGYYKKMSNLIEYNDGASYLNLEGDWQDKVASNGKGKSYGAEVLLQKKTGILTGWIGYTLSKTTRQFDALNFGKEFSYKYDRRHDINIALTHTWDKRRDFSLVWVYGTGNAITLPSSVYLGSSNNYDTRFSGYYEITYYGDRNSYRMKSYHRLDLSFSWWKNKKWGQRKWTIGIYNVYNRLNPFFIELGQDENRNPKLIEYSLFPILPSISYSFKF